MDPYKQKQNPSSGYSVSENSDEKAERDKIRNHIFKEDGIKSLLTVSEQGQLQWSDHVKQWMEQGIQKRHSS